MSYNWTTDSLFNKDISSAKPAEIFKAFCDELGNYFNIKGLNYRKSKRIITFEDNEVKIDIGFNSSRSNMRGQWIGVELGINIYWKELVRLQELRGEKVHGGVIGDISIFSKRLGNEEPGTIVIQNIFGEVIKRTEENSEAEFRYNKAFNIHGLTAENFQKIIDFFETNILNWSRDIRDEEKVRQLIVSTGTWGRWMLNSGNFKRFLELRYPALVKELELINNRQQNLP
jgi:hypothetical protein